MTAAASTPRPPAVSVERVVVTDGRLAYRDGKPGYLADLPLVWQYVRDVGNRHQEIRPMIGLLERAIGGLDVTRPRGD